MLVKTYLRRTIIIFQTVLSIADEVFQGMAPTVTTRRKEAISATPIPSETGNIGCLLGYVDPGQRLRMHYSDENYEYFTRICVLEIDFSNQPGAKILYIAGG